MLGETNGGRSLLREDMSRGQFIKAVALVGALPLLRKADIFPAREAAEASRGSLITVHNGQFHQNGRPVGFIGENWWSIGEDPASVANSICGPEVTAAQRKQWIQDVNSLGMNIVRFWDFPQLTANGRDTRAADQVLALAAQHGILVYPTFENQFHDCTGSSENKPTSWYARGTRNNYQQTYLPYVKAMTRRFKGDNRIFGFQLINEAQCDDPNVLRNFAYDVLNEVKAIDPHRLVTLGVLGANQPGVVGGNFRRLFTPRNGHDHRFDFIDIHDWPGSYPGSYKNLPGNSTSGIYARLQTASELNMPLLISEMGRARTHGLTDQEAANLDRVEIGRLLTYRAFAGLLGWALLPRGISSDGTTYGVNSPEAQMLKSFSSKIKDPRLR